MKGGLTIGKVFFLSTPICIKEILGGETLIDLLDLKVAYVVLHSVKNLICSKVIVIVNGDHPSC